MTHASHIPTVGPALNQFSVIVMNGLSTQKTVKGPTMHGLENVAVWCFCMQFECYQSPLKCCCQAQGTIYILQRSDRISTKQLSPMLDYQPHDENHTQAILTGFLYITRIDMVCTHTCKASISNTAQDVHPAAA